MPKLRKISFGLLTFLFILLSSLCVIEMGLRFSGWAINARQRISNPTLSFTGNEYRILAIGESTTAQLWSNGRDESWPGQLQELLNKDNLGKKFVVINQGVGGITSPLILEEFDDWLEEYKPNLVISMMGVNDGSSVEVRRRSWFESLRVFKVAKWAQSAWRRRGLVRESDQEYFAAEEGLKKTGKFQNIRSIEDVNALDKVVEGFALQSGLPRWLVYRQAGVQFYSEYAKHRFIEKLPELLLQRIIDSSRRFIYAANDLNKKDALTLRYVLYTSNVSDKYRAISIERVARSVEAGAELDLATSSVLSSIEPKLTPRIASVLKAADVEVESSPSPFASTIQNYLTLANRLRDSGIEYMAMQYPTLTIDSLRNIFSTAPRTDFRTIYDSYLASFGNIEIRPEYRQIIFVSNENFNGLVDANNYKEYFTDMFTQNFGGHFGHTTSLGHLTIAKNAEAAIVRNWAQLRTKN